MPESQSKTVLLCAPGGRDATVAARLLEAIGADVVIAESLQALFPRVDDTICFVVVTEEALRGVDLRPLAAKLADQPTWSDLPIIILTRQGGGPERSPTAVALVEALGNVSFLERPFHPTTFASVAGTALKNRHRQFEARARIDEVREGEYRLATALAAGRLGSWELDLQTNELSTSATCRAAFGRGPETTFSYGDLLGSVHPDDKERMQRSVRRTVETGQDYAIEYRTVWPAGGDHWVEVHARRVRDASGRDRLVGVSQDITARKLAEVQLATAKQQLEVRVAERTLELENAHKRVLAEIAQREKTEQQLLQAQKMEMIGQLTGGVAHDFNNLLMAVIANLDLLKKHLPADPRIGRLIDGAVQGANRGASLTQRLLAFARRQELQLSPVEISTLVGGITDLIAKSAGPSVEIRMELGDNLPAALVDANQVELALLNLVVNARDAMVDGGVVSIATNVVVIDGDNDLASGRYISLSVTDVGSGMSEETLAKAVEPFFSTKGVGKGTGLGLSMVQGLAIQLNGALRLSSTLGKGRARTCCCLARAMRHSRSRRQSNGRVPSTRQWLRRQSLSSMTTY